MVSFTGNTMSVTKEPLCSAISGCPIGGRNLLLHFRLSRLLKRSGPRGPVARLKISKDMAHSCSPVTSKSWKRMKLASSWLASSVCWSHSHTWYLVQRWGGACSHEPPQYPPGALLSRLRLLQVGGNCCGIWWFLNWPFIMLLSCTIMIWNHMERVSFATCSSQWRPWSRSWCVSPMAFGQWINLWIQSTL